MLEASVNRLAESSAVFWKTSAEKRKTSAEKRKSSAEKRKSNENLSILIGLETIEIVSANRIKAVAIATKSHNSVEAVSKFKMAGFRLKSGFKSLKKQGLQVKKTAKKAWDSKRRHWCLFFWNYQEKKTSVRPFYRC